MLNALVILLSAVILALAIERASHRLLRELPALVRRTELAEQGRGVEALAASVRYHVGELAACKGAFEEELRLLREYIARQDIRAKLVEGQALQGRELVAQAGALILQLRELIDELLDAAIDGRRTTLPDPPPKPTPILPSDPPASGGGDGVVRTRSPIASGVMRVVDETEEDGEPTEIFASERGRELIRVARQAVPPPPPSPRPGGAR